MKRVRRVALIVGTLAAFVSAMAPAAVSIFCRAGKRCVLLATALSCLAPLPSNAQKLPLAVAAADKPIHEGQALIKEKKFPDALAKFGEVQGGASAIPQATLRLFYQVTAQLGSATALDGMQRYDAALDHANWANETVAGPQAKQLPTRLKAAVHHTRGVILYHLKRDDDAKAMFDLAAKEGDKTAAGWRKAIDAPPPSIKAADLAAAADKAAQNGKSDQALLLLSPPCISSSNWATRSVRSWNGRSTSRCARTRRRRSRRVPASGSRRRMRRLPAGRKPPSRTRASFCRYL
jgi:hypothetical protein